MKPTLTESDYQKCADKLGVKIAVIKAVAEVESKGNGFYGDGFPVILFERHKFSKYSGGRFDRDFSEISNCNAGGYGKSGANQRRKFNLAFSLDAESAMKACSWGKFQIMGFNYALCGYSDVGSFVDAMKESEGKQLEAFTNFIIKNNLASFLRSRNWARFASGYNGTNYSKNQYDEKLKHAYNKFKNQKNTELQQIKSNQSFNTIKQVEKKWTESNQVTDTATEIVTTATANTTQGEVIQTVEKINQQPVNETVEIVEPEKQGVFAKLTGGIGALFSGTVIYTVLEKLGAASLSQTVLILLIVVIIIGFVGFCFWAFLDAWKAKSRLALEIESKTRTDRKDFVWISPEDARD